MDNTTPTPTMTPNEPQMQPSTPPVAPKKSGGTGAFIGSLIIILVLIVGAVYVWNSILKQANPQAEIEPSTLMAETGTELTGSDETAAIEADLDGSNYDDLDREVADIEAEFEANQ